MSTPEYLIIQINELTTLIETRYPELYKFLEEQPLTLPTNDTKEMDEKLLSDYLESLNQLLKHHVITHNKN
ncbi:hypothetical protein [uncultured Aquimarina sp.]|uniref:hypothetical protein n=1 Tax=uncultured Aquimarina sp. TaxID=575652 RepID=UPI002623E3BD|nr:hypothetical protein [uncultured Aquimarina sp.]